MGVLKGSIDMIVFGSMEFHVIIDGFLCNLIDAVSELIVDIIVYGILQIIVEIVFQPILEGRVYEFIGHIDYHFVDIEFLKKNYVLLTLTVS